VTGWLNIINLNKFIIYNKVPLLEFGLPNSLFGSVRWDLVLRKILYKKRHLSSCTYFHCSSISLFLFSKSDQHFFNVEIYFNNIKLKIAHHSN
jgi:hypothetical protein